MTHWIGPLVIALIAALGAHWATLAFAPSFIMDRALSTLENRGIAEHAFTSPVRITPQTQAVVRTSPDMFYSLCRYDLSQPGSLLTVTMSAWPDYQSLSFFDAETNNYLTQRGTGEGIEVRLARPGASGQGTIESPTTRGVVLIRRLAPTQDLFDAAKAASNSDTCELSRL